MTQTTRQVILDGRDTANAAKGVSAKELAETLFRFAPGQNK